MGRCVIEGRAIDATKFQKVKELFPRHLSTEEVCAQLKELMLNKSTGFAHHAGKVGALGATALLSGWATDPIKAKLPDSTFKPHLQKALDFGPVALATTATAGNYLWRSAKAKKRLAALRNILDEMDDEEYEQPERKHVR